MSKLARIDKEQDNKRFLAECEHCGKQIHETELNYERHGDPRHYMHVCDNCSDYLNEQDILRNTGLV